MGNTPKVKARRLAGPGHDHQQLLAMAQAYTFDPALHVLGKPCKRGHFHEDTGLCLRYIKHGNKKTGRCVACKAELAAEHYQKHRDSILERQKGQPRKRRPMTFADKRRLAHWRKANPVREKLSRKARKKRREARSRSAAGLTPVLGNDLNSCLNSFHGKCAYCGSSCNPTLDHFIPIAKGGRHVKSNLLPACFDCNSNKRDLDPEAWYRSQPFFTEQRWRMILRVLGKQRVPVGQLSLV